VILRDERRGTEWTVAPSGARLGREPSLEIPFPEADTVVSALHARVYQTDDGSWWLEDLESTNGTWVDGRRITAPILLGTGVRFTLGQRGPAIRATIPGQVLRTQAEMPATPPADAASAGDHPVVRLRRVQGGEDLAAAGREVVIGRAPDCAIPLRTVVDTVVSKHHCRVTFEGEQVVLDDLGSRNGTFLNGQAVSARVPLRPGDRIMLGWEGPTFEVRALGAAALGEAEGAPYRPRQEPPKTLAGIVQVAGERARQRPGSRAVVFAGAVLRQLATESSRTFRLVTLGLITALAVAVVVIYRMAAHRTAEAEARLASAEHAFANQMRSATEAQQRSNVEISQLQQELAAARRQAVSRSVLDSLERRLREAEARASASSGAAAGGSGADFTRVARDNQGAVGLVITRFGSDSVMGSGFVVTRSGFFVTNRHVVLDEVRGPARSVMVVMAETNVGLPADVIAVSTVQEQDVAVLRVRGYHGPTVRAVDWFGRGAQQGAPAAMLGFPFGTQMALDPSGIVRASMFGGIIAQTGDWIRFSGSTYAGVSGSPVFNAAGEVIAVHFGAPREGVGLGLSVPMSRVRRWLPPEARSELGL